MRRLVLLLLACAPPAVDPAPPAPPTLVVPTSSAAAPYEALQFTLRGTTEDDTRVRVFASRSCLGQPLLQLDAEALRAGRQLDSVHGENVFSARAFSVSTGLQSRCSEPVSLFVLIPSRGQLSAPTVQMTVPRVPTSAPAVRLVGTAPRPGWTVRVWASLACEGELLASMPGDDYAREGLLLPLRRNATLRVTLDAIRGAEMTLCNGGVLTLTNDSEPPPAPRPSWFPAPPIPFPRLGLVVEGVEEGASLVVSDGSGCLAPLALVTGRVCTGCPFFVEPLDAGHAMVSVRAEDAAGNQSPCVEVPDGARDASLPVPPVYAEARRAGSVVIGVGVSQLQATLGFYSGPECRQALSRGSGRAFLTTGALPSSWSFGIEGDGGVCWNGP